MKQTKFLLTKYIIYDLNTANNYYGSMAYL